MKYFCRIVNDKDYKVITGKLIFRSEVKMATVNSLPAQNLITTSYRWKA